MKSIFRHCGRAPLWGYALSCPLATLASIAFAMSLQPIIDEGLSGDTGRLAAATAAAAALACADALSAYSKNVQKKRAVSSYVKGLRLHYFQLFFQQDIARFLEKDSGDHLSKLTADAEVIGNKYCENILNLYGALWSLAVSFVCIAATRWELAVYVVVISLVSANLPRLFQRKANASEQDYLDSSGAHIGAAQESIRNYLVIRLFQLTSSQIGRYARAASDVEKKDNARQKRAFAVDAAAGVISSLSFILIIALCMLFVLRGELSVGYTMSVSQMLGGVMYPFEMLPGYLVACRAGKSISRANEAELRAHRREEGGQRLCLTHRDDHITADNISFAYSAGRPLLLRELSLSLDLKKKYAVVGESGSGKSTLARLLMGLLEPTSGAVSFHGVPLREIDKSSLYDAVTYQNQTVSFFDGTIRENILLGRQLPRQAWRGIIAAARLEDTLRRLPEGEDTVIEENGKNISGGEAQRICLARCLARRPAFIIFDEIAASLDTRNAQAIERAILSLKDVGVLQITHRIYEENMRQYDAIFVLKDGRIAEQGTWDQLTAMGGEFCRLAGGGTDSGDGG